ncbi:MAG TPA: proton-conducting transporter membrane subunit [Candidatus Limnocylindrales bacterium]|nr:proton-conducting transporter membrane subunit [Candidatus Limnocylindrales bacterium]
MTVLLLAAVAIGFGLVTIVVGPTWRRSAVAIGVVGSLAVLVIALSMPAEESLALGGVGLVGTPLVREMAVAWSAGLAALGLLEVGVGGRPTVVGPGLVGLAVAVVALATRDPASSVAALAAGGVAGVLVPGLSGWTDGGAESPSRLATTSRGSLAVLGSGLLGLAVIAFGASAAGPLGAGAAAPNDPGVRLAAGLALLAMVGAVAIRCGLIPLHVWAARFMEGVSPLAIPALFAWGSAAFVLVAIDWSQVALGPTAAGDTERFLIIAVSFVSLVLGGLAAMVHDDIEHVLGYSILQDAGVAVLAFASLEPEVAAAARNWLVASATIKTALAAWAAVVRSTYGGHRLADLGGWARHSPVLGVSFAAILVAAVGLPGIAIWESRSSLITSAMPGFAAIVTPLIATMPVIYLGRIALAGVEPIGRAVAAGPSGRPSWKGVRTAGWSKGGLLDVLRAVPVEVRANRVPLMALGVLLLAAMAVVTAIGGTGG